MSALHLRFAEPAGLLSAREVLGTFALCQAQHAPQVFSLAELLPASTAPRYLQQLYIVYKPHRLHTLALRHNREPSLEEYLRRFYSPQTLPPDQGLIQRLDYETAGLLLQTPCAETYTWLLQLQTQGRIKKNYLAWSPRISQISSPIPQDAENPQDPINLCKLAGSSLPALQTYCSYFRPYGPKGYKVRLVSEMGSCTAGKKPYSKKHKLVGPYGTSIEQALPSSVNGAEGTLFQVSLHKGFRHQVRVQLAALGFPLKGDPLYGEAVDYHGVVDGGLPSRSYRKEHPAPSSQTLPFLGLLAYGIELSGHSCKHPLAITIHPSSFHQQPTDPNLS